jgi:hypothetical protein
MSDSLNSPNNHLPSTDPLVNRFFLTAAEKKDKQRGKDIVKAFYTQQTNGDTLSFFKKRNHRWKELMLWAKGSQPIEDFLNYINVSDADNAYINLDTTQTRIGAKFVGTLVESMSKTKTYACVNAIDDGSLSEKEDRMLDALFRMHDAEEINQIQQKAGVLVEPQGAYVPPDEITAKVYFELEDRLPKEIKFEQKISKTQNDIHFEKVLNRKTIYDLTVLNAGFTKIDKCGPKEYTIRKCISPNMVYNFFMNDTGEQEISQIGEFYNVKVKDFREKFGKSQSNPDGLTEKEIFELAKTSTTKAAGSFGFMWQDSYFNLQADYPFNSNRPYDDCSILVLDCEINCGEEVYFVERTDAYGKTHIAQKSSVPYQQVSKSGQIIQQPKPDNVEIIKKKKQTWMRGVYAPYGDKMLYWGRPDLIISQYTDTYKCLSSYTVNIPNNDGEYVPSLFERGMEILREYQLTKLKRKQIIALIEPDAFRIDIESARNIDLGTGDTIPWKEIIRIKNQTGVEVWSSKGINPLERQAPPITPGTQSTNVSKVIELTNVLAGLVAELRDVWGVPVYRDGADVGDRTAARLAEGQSESSFNVTDFILNANNELWEETFYKLCLLHWNDVVKEEPESESDMLNTRFDVAVKIKSTEYQRQLLERDIDRFSQMPDMNGQPLLTPKDAMMLREIDNYKLASHYLASIVEENKRRADEMSRMRQQENTQSQQESLKLKGEEDRKTLDMQLQMTKDLEAFKALQQMKVEVLKGAMTIATKTETPQMPSWMIPIIQQLVPNVTIPVMIENQNTQEAIAQQQQAEQQAAQQQAAFEQLPPEQQQAIMNQQQQAQMQ